MDSCPYPDPGHPETIDFLVTAQPKSQPCYHWQTMPSASRQLTRSWPGFPFQAFFLCLFILFGWGRIEYGAQGFSHAHQALYTEPPPFLLDWYYYGTILTVLSGLCKRFKSVWNQSMRFFVCLFFGFKTYFLCPYAFPVSISLWCFLMFTYLCLCFLREKWLQLWLTWELPRKTEK